MAKKVIKLDVGSIYQKEEGGVYFFRYQINGKRKAVSLKTKNKDEAIKQAESLIPVVKATSTEVISAHVQQARNLTNHQKSIPLSEVWGTYTQQPDRARPATVREIFSYQATLQEFVDFVKDPKVELRDVTQAMAEKFSEHLRTTQISVSTHNRKIKRLCRIFQALRPYRNENNPFSSSSLLRREREEQEQNVRRLSFTREQEQKLLEALLDQKYKVMHKPEVRVIYHIGMFTGQRMKDCVLLRWDRINLDMKRIWVKQFKTGKEVTIPIAPKLMEVLLEAQTWKTDEYVCPNVAARYKKVDANGKNTGNNLVNIDVLRVIRWIGLEPSVDVEGRKKKVTMYGFHSLRHSFASHCAVAGVPKAVVTSILGADSEIVDRYYTHIGNEAQEKAILAISGDVGGTKSDRERIEEALGIIRVSKDSPENILQQVKAILEGS
ncbi:MAG: tyrosine-type recombinase/integrase [Alphaproteobacteria bacterium]|nr:tyrosine-type recombinase/integrase [Alphaproteobacteria bacterium]